MKTCAQETVEMATTRTLITNVHHVVKNATDASMEKAVFNVMKDIISKVAAVLEIVNLDTTK